VFVAEMRSTLLLFINQAARGSHPARPVLETSPILDRDLCIRLQGIAPRCSEETGVTAQHHHLVDPRRVGLFAPVSSVFCPLLPRSLTRLSLSFVFSFLVVLSRVMRVNEE
jgi:hypothetical protein